MIEPLGIFGQYFFDGRRAQVAALDQALGEVILAEGVAVTPRSTECRKVSS
jgi:hypothetical protein